MVRSPMQVDEEFRKKMKELKENIMRNKGEDPSFRELTKLIVADPNFKAIENRLLSIDDLSKIDINIKLDKRLFK